MPRVKDLWFSEVKDPNDPKKKIKRKTARHPDRGGSKDAKRWLAIWIDPAGKEASKAFAIREAAKTYAGRQEADVDRGAYIDPTAGKELFGPLAQKWLRLCDVGAISRERYESTNRLHIEPTFGHRRAASVKPSETLEWLRALSRSRGASTQAMALFILRGVFDLAVADGIRRDNPAKASIIPTPKPDATEREAWSVDRLWLVIDAHEPPYRPIPIVSAGCGGLRQGEALALAVEDFDFEAGKIRIGRQLIKVRGGKMVAKLPKGGKVRTAPLPAGVARVVQAHLEAYPPRAISLPWMLENGDFAEEEHVCTLLFRWQGDHPSTHDQPIRESSYNGLVWKPALAAAGVIPEPLKGPRGGVLKYEASREDGTHALRHWYTTTLLDSGVNLSGIMEFVGHSTKSAPITVRVYGHVTEETFEQTRNVIDRTLFRLRAVQDQRSSGTGTERAVSQ